MKRRKSDILWKVIIEEAFPDLLRFIFPDADEVFDMERGFEYLDKELAELDPQPDEEKDSRFADKLIKIYHRNGEEECVLLHIEIQGDSSDPAAFAERIYTYFYRIRDKHHSPVSALVIFTGQNGRQMPVRYSYAYRGTRLTYEYPALYILDYSDEELDRSSNPFAHVIVAAKMRLKEGKIAEEELLQIKLKAARRLMEKGFDAPKVRSILRFLNNYVLIDNPETNRKFVEVIRESEKTYFMNFDEYERMMGREEGIEQGRGQGLLEGLEKGRSEGQEEAKAAFVVNLLQQTEFSIDQIASLANVTMQFVNEIKLSLKRCN